MMTKLCFKLCKVLSEKCWSPLLVTFVFYPEQTPLLFHSSVELPAKHSILQQQLEMPKYEFDLQTYCGQICIVSAGGARCTQSP